MMLTRIKTALVLLGILLFGLAAGASQPALAQDTITLDQLLIRFWPEFDRTEMLVFVAGEVAPGTELPVDLTFTLPPGAEINAVAYIDSTGQSLLIAPHQIDGNTVTMTSETGSFHIEYYDPGLEISGDQRDYRFSWAANYAAAELIIDAQHPHGASDFQMEPAGGVDTTDQYGLPTTRVTAGPVAAGETIDVSISYGKSDSVLTVDLIAAAEEQSASSDAASSAEPVASTGGSGGAPQWLAISLVVLGVALIGGGVVWYLRTMRADDSPGAARGRQFCTQCGKPVGAEDKFCRHCGARL